MPKRYHFHEFRRASYMKIKVVPNTPNMNAANAVERDVRGARTNLRLRGNKRQKTLKFFANGIRRCRTVATPPIFRITDVLRSQ